MAENTNATEVEVVETGVEEEEVVEPTLEERLSTLMAENAKLKRDKDKASSEAANYKKQVMASKSEAEQKAIEKAEADAKMKEELDQLRKESALNKLEKSFVALGYSEDMAKKAAEAQYEGDTDSLFGIQKKFFSEKEKTMKATLMKNMPSANISNDAGESEKDPFLANW